MLKKKEIKKLKEHLERATNPLFYFDNDQDGLCSFLLLRRFYGKGNGVPVKTSPLGKEYLRRIDEFEPDCVFVLDQPTVSDEFVEAVKERNLPLIWIDHHEVRKKNVPKSVEYFNPFLSSKTTEPVTKVCYDLISRKEDLWICVAGCIADKFVPEEYGEFGKTYLDLYLKSDDAFEIFFRSEIGKLSRILGMGLKDRTTLVNKMIRFLIKAKTPYEVLEESVATKSFYDRFNSVNKKLDALVEKARRNADENVLFFEYASDVSMSADIANRLSFEFPNKFVVVIKDKGDVVNMSLRGKGVKKIFLKAIESLDGAKGGGHKDAVGGQMPVSELWEFKKRFLVAVD